ncbi:MAG: PQQ-binding-like beta-propeller repeat protein [Verrucomicrobia bacterium]|nr:PQQ-binding-like beta-propeller repeat protein [Verrucomicrobiota bacterium]
MGLEGGVLYALVGQDEQRDAVVRPRLSIHGWPWDPLSPGFNQPINPWGYGRTLLAIELQTRQVLWHYREEEPMDSRALCMKGTRLYAFRFGAYLTCLDTATGKVIWRHTKETTPDLFRALGSYLQRQGPWENWRTTAYLKCNDQALYFAGPCMNKLLALAASDGRVLWSHPYNNNQLVLLDDAVVGISGILDSAPSRRFHPFTGDILSAIKVGRMACTRPTAYPEAVFFRCVEGSTRLDLATDRPQLVSPMRAQCHDGVTMAHGRLYWWPSACDCNLTLYGITCLGPAGDFAFSQNAIESDRLEVGDGLAHAAQPALRPEPPSPSHTGLSDGATPAGAASATLVTGPEDWPTFRADNTVSTTSAVAVPEVVRLAWETRRTPGVIPTSPTAVGDLVFVAGSDGIVRALAARTGQPAWTAYTGGAVLYPPTIGEGRALVGAGDGWVYALDARTGQRLWRFRVAPSERRIPVYGSLRSTWPAASGVLLQDGVAYVAAGIVNYDGTHVYALDAATGRIRWQNHSSGHLDPEARTGVSVQGHLGFLNGKLYLPGGMRCPRPCTTPPAGDA